MRTPVLFFPAAVLLAPALLAQRFPEVEPNDTAATAQVVTLGSQIDATLTAGEADYYRFTTAGGNVRMFAHATTSVDLQFELRDDLDTITIAANDDSSGLFPNISVNLPPGTYVLRVDGFSASTAGAYQIEFGEMSLKPFNGAEQEPNDSLALANPIASGAQITASLTPGDQDWYRVDITIPKAGVWFQITEGDAPWVSNHRYEIYDAAGVLLAPTGTFGANAANSSNFAIRNSQIRCWPAGSYYIVVKNSTAPSGLGLTVPTGNYRLEYIEMPMNVGAIVPEVEPNNSVATATPMNFGDMATGSITVSTGADPSDIYGPFVITQPSVFQVQSTQFGGSPLLDSTVRLLSATGGVLLTFTTGNILTTTSHGRGTVSAFLAPATYYVEVLSPGTSASMAGTYALEIGINTVPYVTASYAFANVNTACLGSNALRPTISIDSTGERPVLGTNFSRKFGSMPASSLFVLIQGLSDTMSGMTPLPFSLAPLGAPSCTVNVDPVAITFMIANPAGELVYNSLVAGSVVFRGMPIYEQILCLDPAANALGITASNYALQVLGERNY